MNILIPMAGQGKRFKDAGYRYPKPFIGVWGKPMVQRVTENLEFPCQHIFVMRKEHHFFSWIVRKATQGPLPPLFVFAEEDTEGAACTTLLAEKHINNDEQLIIANTDQIFGWNKWQFLREIAKPVDGAILTFRSQSPKFSYSEIGGDGFIKHVAEKEPISPHATVGVYYWRRGSDYVKYAKQMIEKNIRTNNEFFVCPVYNGAIADGARIIPFEVDWMQCLGTPEDLEEFLDPNSS